MKVLTLLFILLITTSICLDTCASQDPRYIENCLNYQLSDEEKNNGYSCCHIKYKQEKATYVHCSQLKKEEIEPTKKKIIDDIKKYYKEETEINIVCSEEELKNLKEVEDEYSRNKCEYNNPYSEKHCFQRNISEYERNKNPLLNLTKCCYVYWKISNRDEDDDFTILCLAADEANNLIYPYIKNYKYELKCPDSQDLQDIYDESNSTSSFLYNNIYYYILFTALIS
jgi:hypothetical protein